MEPILKVQNLSISFGSGNEQNKVVNEVSFELNPQQILGIVGESGSGKSVTSLAILGLLPKNATISGSILFNDTNLQNTSEKEFQKIRGNKISMIFQEPMSSLNPSLTCGYQVQEILLQHKKLSKKEAKNQAIALFHKVKLPRAEVM
ncbi:MAG: ATP-binding cassette domain-containing protein, partial [Lutibacter sp.]